MSKDFFKVKKGLNIKPTDPSTLEALEDGDIIIDSTDDNRMKVYDSAGGDFASVGTGGSSGNFLADFEKLTPDLSSVTSVVDTVTFLPIDDNNKSVKTTWAASAGYIQYESAVPADVEGQGLMTVWLKTSVEGLTLSTTTDGVVQSTLSVIANNKWKQYEIPYVIGGTEQGFRVEASGSVTGDVFIDEAFVGLAPSGYIQDVGQASFVGDVYFNSSNCSWSIPSGTTWQSFPVNSNCIYSTRGNVLAPDTKIPAVKIPNARTDGYYQIKFNGTAGTTSASATDDRCDFNLSDTGSQTTYGGYAHTEVRSTQEGSRFFNELTGQFRFTTTGTKQVELLAKPNFSGDNCGVFANDSGFGGTISVHFFPDNNSTIVSQNTELTAQTANEFSGFVNCTSTSSITDSTYSAFSSISNISSGSCNVTYSAEMQNSITQPLRITVSGTSSGIDINYNITSSTTTGFTVKCTTTSGNCGAFGAFIVAQKHDNDLNKSATIIGKFENINSSELIQLKYDKATVQTVSTFVSTIDTILYDNKVYDNSNGAYDTSTGVFTAPRDGTYKICASWMWQADSWPVDTIHWFYVGDKIVDRHEKVTTNSNFYSMNGCNTVFLSAGEQQILARIQQNSGSDKQNIASVSYNFVTLEEQATTESIIKNLSQEQTKCQTKTLNTTASMNGVIPDLTFSNLIVGKKYEIKGQVALQPNTDVSMNAYINSLRVARSRSTGSSNINVFAFSSTMFNATNTTLTFEHEGTGSVLSIGGGTSLNNGTKITLCELPSTFVETDEW